MPRKPSPHSLAIQADRLPLDDLKQLVAYLSAQIQERESSDSQDKPTPEAGWRSEYRKCGKSNCRCADGQHLHGPYWYRSMREGDRISKQYWRKGKAIDR